MFEIRTMDGSQWTMCADIVCVCVLGIVTLL